MDYVTKTVQRDHIKQVLPHAKVVMLPVTPALAPCTPNVPLVQPTIKTLRATVNHSVVMGSIWQVVYAWVVILTAKPAYQLAHAMYVKITQFWSAQRASSLPA